MEYTTNGINFQAPSPNPNFVGTSQDAKRIMGVDRAFGLVGLYTDDKDRSFNGLTASFDGGMTWKDYDTGVVYPWARYGHFPDPNNWYITLGAWPGDLDWDDSSEARVLNQKLRIHNKLGAQFRHQVIKSAPAIPVRPNRSLLQTIGYWAMIAKTTDAGKTWQIVYNDTNNFYFNDIDCPTINDCWAVGESESDSPQPGVRIVHTADGGKTWDVQMYLSDPNYSLMDVGFVNATEGWAVGGYLSARNFSGEFFHTSDGGQHWTTAQALSDEYATALSFVTSPTSVGGYLGWATALTEEGASSILGYF